MRRVHSNCSLAMRCPIPATLREASLSLTARPRAAGKGWLHAAGPCVKAPHTTPANCCMLPRQCNARGQRANALSARHAGERPKWAQGQAGGRVASVCAPGHRQGRGLYLRSSTMSHCSFLSVGTTAVDGPHHPACTSIPRVATADARPQVRRTQPNRSTHSTRPRGVRGADPGKGCAGRRRRATRSERGGAHTCEALVRNALLVLFVGGDLRVQLLPRLRHWNRRSVGRGGTLEKKTQFVASLSGLLGPRGVIVRGLLP